MLNNGDGTFQAARVLSMNDPQGIFVEDLDGDEDYDLAVVEGYLDSVSVFLNNGDGSFQPGVNYPVGESPRNVFSADLNGDLSKDLAVTNHQDHTISVLLNNGDGTFQPAMNFEAEAELRSILLADLDNDDDNDIAFEFWVEAGCQGYTFVATMQNDGSGVFADPIIRYSFGDKTFAGQLVAADVDDDLDNDLVATCRGVRSQLVILENLGSWVFYPDGTHELNDPRGIAAADLDGDADCDLALPYCGHDVTHDDLRLYLNNGDGTFEESGDYVLPIGPSSIIAADLDGDGDRDLAVASQDNSVTVLLNDGSANFQRQAPFDYGTGWFPLWLTGADFDGDGDVDLVTSNDYTDDITILFNLTNTYYMSGDANGDGLVDVGDVIYLINYLYKGGTSPDPLWVGDLNCDGQVNLGDVVYLINYLFKAGPPPGC
jgi:hypothetical protein